MIDESINTYYYDVITTSEVTVNFNIVLNYIREQLLAEGETNITLFAICDYFENNAEEVISNAANCFDFIGDDNKYTLNHISNNFRDYLEKYYGENYKYEKL